MSQQITVRASSLSGYADCPRRTAAKTLKGEVEAAGYSLRETPNNIGAIVGTAMHSGAAVSLTHKMRYGALGNATEAEHVALESLTEEMQKSEMLWDKATPDNNTAQQQTLRMVGALRSTILLTITPLEVEKRLQAIVSENIILSGQVDVNLEDGITDWKSGTVRRANGPQYGAYLLLGRSNNIGNAHKATEYYVPRTTLKKEQPRPEVHPYEQAAAEQSAVSVLKHIERDLLDFRITGDRNAFLANPSSVLCSDKYCPAWGTNFCKDHKKKGESHDNA